MVIMDENKEFYVESDSNDSDDSTADESTLKRKHKNQGNKTKKAKIDDEVLPKLNKSGKTKNELYKQPTAEELNQLRETENLFNSNIFRLQIEELLAEIKIKPKYSSDFDGWFKIFENEILKLTDFKNPKKLCNGVKNEIFNNVENINLKFEKPTRIFKYGDFNNISGKKIKFNGYVGVVMPKSCFYEKDFSNNIYGTKKFYYLHYLMKFLKKIDCVKNVSVDYYLGNLWQPYLLITPNFSFKVRVKLFLVPEKGIFKCSRFLPDKNNIKTNVIENIFTNFHMDNFTTQATLLYNSALVHDVVLQSNQQLIKETLNDLTNVLDGIKLLIVWLKQRNLNCNFRAFTNDLLINIILYLALKRKITKHMSSYQVVRIFWSFLSGLKDGEILSISDVKDADLELFKGWGKFVLLDISGCFNVAAFLDEEIFTKIKKEAETALNALDNCRFDSFASLFVTKVPVAVQYDVILKIKSEKNYKSIYKQCTDEEKFKYYGFYNCLIYNRILNYLKYGLNQRAKEIIPIYPNEAKSNLNVITFGINLNQELCSSVIEKGHKQFEPGAEEFKQFWGSLAELRRFKDSSIYEAVYFEHVKTIQDKRLIYKNIIEFIMKNRVKLPYELYGHEMENLIKLDKIKAPFAIGSNEEVTLKIKSILYDLSKVMRDLKLPLAITAIQGNSDSYSYTDVFPPIPTSYYFGDVFATNEDNMLFKMENLHQHTLFFFPPIECVIQLALHSKWPKDLNALRAMKLVFMGEISKLLKEKSIRSSIGGDFIDIYFEGLVFRMRVYHPKEVALLKKDVTNDGETFYKDTEESLRMERELDMLPKIYGALNGIQQEHPSFGPCTCLIKRWLRSQMLDDYHIPDVIVNLLNASLYLSPDPFAPSVLPQIGFLRFLKFMSEFDFENHLVTVNFNEELTNDELNDIETKFVQNRHNYSSICIITPYDKGLSVYSKNSLTENILRRIKCLAAETYKYLTNVMEIGNSLKFKSCFNPNITGYNLLIHLKDTQNPKKYQQITNENQTVKINEFRGNKKPLIPIVNYNPVDLYITELRENYSDYALFFHDFYGGDVIGVLWKTKALEESDFKISTVGARKLTPEQRLSLNTDALIEDFYTLGCGVVDTIVVQNK